MYRTHNVLVVWIKEEGVRRVLNVDEEETSWWSYSGSCGPTAMAGTLQHMPHLSLSNTAPSHIHQHSHRPPYLCGMSEQKIYFIRLELGYWNCNMKN